jgi:hypothetical protein
MASRKQPGMLYPGIRQHSLRFSTVFSRKGRNDRFPWSARMTVAESYRVYSWDWRIFGEKPESWATGVSGRKAIAKRKCSLDCSICREEGTQFVMHPSRSLLAASGITPGRALRDLRALDSQAAASSPFRHADSFDPDNKKFLKGIQQRGRQAMIAESLARVHSDFDAFLEEKVNLNWDEQRRKIFQHFGLAQKNEPVVDSQLETSKGPFGRSWKQPKPSEALPSQSFAPSRNRSVFGRSGFEKSVIGSPGTGLAGSQMFADGAERNEGVNPSADTRFLREKMGYFADKVQRLNSARLDERTFPVFHEFAEVERHAKGDVGFRLFRDVTPSDEGHCRSLDSFPTPIVPWRS